MISVKDFDFAEDKNIFSTIDYDKFRFFDENRELKEFYIKRMMQSIAEKNLLHRYPILVNKDFYILDGQNRFQAARRLGIPIYYKFENMLELDDIIMVQVTQLKWGMEDYLHYYAVKGKKEYIAIDSLLKKYPHSCLSLIIKLFCPDSEAQKKFKKGLLQFECAIDEVDALLNKVNIIVEHLDSLTINKTKSAYIRERTFVHALGLFFRCGNVDYMRFMDKLTLHIGTIRPCTSCAYYIEQFIQIYNYNHKKASERLSKDYYPQVFKKVRNCAK